LQAPSRTKTFKVIPPAIAPQSVLEPGTADPFDELSAEMKQILDHREKFAEHAYGITNTWVGFLIVITIMQFTLKKFGYGLDYKEFIAVFTTITAAVFGFGLLVGNFLFPRNGKRDLK
jgi:hypothetical protein